MKGGGKAGTGAAEKIAEMWPINQRALIFGRQHPLLSLPFQKDRSTKKVTSRKNEPSYAKRKIFPVGCCSKKLALGSLHLSYLSGSGIGKFFR